MERMKFEIDRNRWLRGEGPAASKLYRSSDGKMCCLGQICEQLGVSLETMMNVPTPDMRRNKNECNPAEWRFMIPLGLIQPLLEMYHGGDRPRVCLLEQVGTAMEENDREDRSDPLREAKIAILLAEIGMDITFTG